VPALTLTSSGRAQRPQGGLEPQWWAGLGRRQEYSSAAAEALGWAPRPIDETIVDCARSMLAEG
jgi:hypothetical protein